jgi:fatty-acyl-CoA synthase
MREALMMDDYPLSLTNVIRRAEQFSGDQPVVFRRPDGSIGRTTLGDSIERSKRLGTVLSRLGIGDGDPVATLLWNQPEHLELYFAVPCMGAVLHTLNPRLHRDELSFIINDAEDKAIVIDETLLPVFETVRDARAFSDVIVVRQTDAELPDGYLDYEQLLEDAEPMQWPPDDERQAAAMCYTSGTTGRPKGVV